MNRPLRALSPVSFQQPKYLAPGTTTKQQQHVIIFREETKQTIQTLDRCKL